MRHRLFVLVVSTAALAACGDNVTTNVDAPPTIDARPMIDMPPPPIDARPVDVFVADVRQADGVPVMPDARPPAIDAPPPIDGPPTCPVPGGNAPERQNQAGAASNAAGRPRTGAPGTAPTAAT